MTTESEKTLEQLRAEAKEAEERLAAAQYAAREAEREAQRAEEHRKMAEATLGTYNGLLPFAEKIVDALRAVGYKKAKVMPRKDDSTSLPVIHLDGENWNRLDPEFERAHLNAYSYHSSYSPISPSQFKVVFGMYGARHSYPMLKSGDFNYAKIASTAKGIQDDEIAKQKARDEKRAAETSSGALADAICKEFNISQWYGNVRVRSTQYNGDKVVFSIDLGLTVDPDKARELVKSFREWAVANEVKLS